MVRQQQGHDWVRSLRLLTEALAVAAGEHGSSWAAVHGLLARQEHVQELHHHHASRVA